MPQKIISIEGANFSLVASREAGRYRAFWFCPFNDCYGCYRSVERFKTREDALANAETAARRHHAECHAEAIVWCLEGEAIDNWSGRLQIRG